MELIGYLGPEGSYSHIAAKSMRPEAVLKAYSGFPQVFSSLFSETDGIVVPIENSLNGGVMQNIDLLQSTDGVHAVEEVRIKIDHRLVTLDGADLKDIKTIYSHSQALEQCSKYLAENFPKARLVSVNSTAASLEMVKEKCDAAVAGAHVKRAGLTVSQDNIADEHNNFTRFLLVKRGEIPENSPSRKIYFSVTCPNRSGALLSLLGEIARLKFNMTKIESRPVKDVPDEYRFFIEVEGDYSKKSVKLALNEVRAAANSFKLLGCY